jgi:hypothetical protein
MMGDVSKMFLQVKLAQQDRVFHRFLWTPDPDKEPDEYEFQVHCFGNAGSPSVAISVVRDYARKNIKRFPRAAEAMLDSTHVDDTLDSFKTLEEAIQTAKEIQQLYSEIHMKLRKFASNSKEFMEAFDSSDWAADFAIIGENQTMNFPTKKALGIVWNTQTDSFSFPSTEKLGISMKGKSQMITKRKVLQELSRLFDPLGFISPVLIKARIIMQQCWKDGTDWDEQVTELVEKAWLDWLRKADELPLIKLPRVLIPTKEAKVENIQLHTFCDASEKAYGFVTYIRVQYENKEIFLNLVASKAKIAPMESTSIPRLELEAAVLGSRMSKQLAEILKPNQCVLWTDSTTVLWWINCTNKELKKYVANRQDVILDHSEASQWQHIGTHENPADIVSRGATIGELRVSELWWQGPQFLQKDPKYWPKQASYEATEDAKKELKIKEEMNVCLTLQETSQFINLENYSDWTKLLRTVALLIRTVGTLLVRKLGATITDFPISKGMAYTRAEEWLFKQAQKDVYPEIYSNLKKGKPVINDRLNQLKPKIDKHGVMRCNARLAHTKFLKYDIKCPVILPKNHHITRLLIRHYHEKVLQHVGGHAHTLTELQTKFWIVQGRQACKDLVKQCVTCKLYRNQPLTQSQGSLPDYRIPGQRQAPFTHTIIDAAGPFKVKYGRGTIKRYVILFSCMTTRAIHLEMANDLSQDQFLLTFSRFVSRRGYPEVCRSDNGTNFKGAVNDLMIMGRIWDPEKAEKAV